MEKREPSYIIGGNENLVQLLWKTVWIVLKKLKIELSYDLAIPLLSIYPDKTIIKKTHAPHIITEAIFTIAKIWRELNVHQQMNG